jgi:translation initiation factor eIF-2B subunit epsilon
MLFTPLQCLLPLLNEPLLSWTLESLSSSRVRRVYVFVRDGIDEIKAWLEYVFSVVSPLPVLRLVCSASPYAKDSTFEVILRATAALSPGDVLREADSLPLAGDFLLVRAGYVGNLDLQQAVNNFAEKRRRDNGLVMDCLVRPVHK